MEVAKLSFITLEEQLLFVSYFEAKVGDMGKRPDSHPKAMLVTAIFLALKVETSSSSLIALDDLLKKLKNTLTREDVLNHEISQEAFLKSIQSDKNTQALLAQVYKNALVYGDAAQRSDLIFMFWPSQIALACFIVSSKKESSEGKIFQPFLEKYLASQLKNDPRYEILNETILGRLDHMLEEALQKERGFKSLIATNKTIFQEISQKVQNCGNPEFIPGSNVYNLIQKEIDDEKAEKRKRKLEKSSSALSLMEESFPSLG
ncbi:hypothetical protein HK096_005936 [Nowakowskiella sp. JEL0078]|nr:hypothetical protein HK096_005936 [Nowakowskiella sp. JEL0078]